MKTKKDYKDCNTLNMFLIYLYVKQNNRIKKSSLRLHYQEYNYQRMSNYLNALIQNGFLIKTSNAYIAEEVPYSSELADKLFDTFQNLENKPVIRHKKNDIKMLLKDKIAQSPFLFNRPDKVFKKYSKMAKAYTVIRYLEINYHKTISYTLFNKIFPKLNIDIRTLELRYHKNLFRIDENKHIRVNNLGMNYFAPRITRNGNLLRTSSHKYFYPRTDKVEYIDNDDAIEEFIAKYQDEINLDNKSTIALTRREKDTLKLIENNSGMTRNNFVQMAAKYFNIRKQNIYTYVKNLINKNVIKINKGIIITDK